ncbi:zinc ribbon domain-containing protein [Desulfuromonas sp. AOP6]|uniref:zinc ribbon domain-containing protein n=1 Tax=Desulfuromonas sp. AOP6 TaxID=1566351 RepID=UPI0012847A3E|nr:zinc ribbon domain-containing protein [Desulfuromonas sp. AOP6]BCA78926.1 hypothetical protein AOP6_0713 [Desulfuromonas sp. AOP6]
MGLGRMVNNQMGKVRAHLTQLDGQPLGKAAFVILLFLDLFILIAIFNGLDEHTRQLPSPAETIPQTCREMVIDREWNPSNRTDNLGQIVTAHSGSYYRLDEKKKDLHPVCAPYIDLLDQVKTDENLVSAFEDRKQLQFEAKALQRSIDSLKGAYDTTLLENIARQPSDQPTVAAIKGEVQQKTGALNALTNQLAALERTINEDARVRSLWEKLQGIEKSERDKLLAELRRLNFWYPVKKLGMQLLFLLPLFAVFYAWNAVSIRHHRGVQALVSSHLLVVAFIPIFGKIVETIYDIIPHKLLDKLIDILVSFKLVAIWHYLVMALAIAAGLFLIYLFQKKLFTRERLIDRRIAKGECQQCGRHLPAEACACPFCGFQQFTPCEQCHALRHVHGRFCRKCGAPSP